MSLIDDGSGLVTRKGGTDGLVETFDNFGDFSDLAFFVEGKRIEVILGEEGSVPSVIAQASRFRLSPGFGDEVFAFVRMVHSIDSSGSLFASGVLIAIFKHADGVVKVVDVGESE